MVGWHLDSTFNHYDPCRDRNSNYSDMGNGIYDTIMVTRYRKYPIRDFKDFIEIMLKNNATIQEIADKCHFSYHETYKYMKQEGLIEKYQRRLRNRKPTMKMVKEVKHWPPQVRKLKYFPLRIPPTE